MLLPEAACVCYGSDALFKRRTIRSKITLSAAAAVAAAAAVSAGIEGVKGFLLTVIGSSRAT